MHRKLNYIKYFLFVALILFFSTVVIVVSVIILHSHFKMLLPGLDNRNTVSLIGFLFLSLLVSVALSFILVQQVLKPLLLFISGTKSISEGNFEVRLPTHSSIDEIKNLSTNFNNMAEQLERIATLRNDFIANVSHEFKTPLSVIEGYAALLQSKELSPTTRDRYLDQIIESTHQLSSMTSHLLELSKLENLEESELEQTRFEVDEQIRTAILWLAPKWQPKNLVLNIKLDAIKITGNQPLLMDVWINLIGNAVKFSNPESSLEIILKEFNTSIEFTITNHGEPISKNDQLYIFDQFFQSDTSHAKNGNGLGLSLVRKIIQLHNGTIRLLNSDQNETTFKVKIPKHN